jgi:hypothetical protein
MRRYLLIGLALAVLTVAASAVVDRYYPASAIARAHPTLP